jgi:hypothetical protein
MTSLSKFKPGIVGQRIVAFSYSDHANLSREWAEPVAAKMATQGMFDERT